MSTAILFAQQITWATEDSDQSPPNSAVTQEGEIKLRTPEKSAIPGAPGKRVRFSPDTTLIAGPPSDTSPEAQKRHEEEIQIRIQDLQKQQEQTAHDYQEMMKALQQTLPPSVQLDLTRRQLQKRYAEVQSQLAEQMEKQVPAVAAAPLPENAAIGAFTLKYVRPEDIGQALHNITGGGGPRVAVDERTNTLLIAGNPKQMDVAKQLVQTLDQPGKTQQSAAPEALQLRIVWLSEGMSDRDMAPPSATIISAPVADALRELGMEQPQVVCQQLTSVTLKPAGPAGKYVFRVPTEIEDSTWNFEGDGTIMPTSDGRYAMDFKLSLVESNSKNPQPSELSGSILTPLGHYTVMGTTTFVAPRENAGPVQRLSAFVVFLDHPKEFGYAGSSESDSKKSDKKNK